MSAIAIRLTVLDAKGSTAIATIWVHSDTAVADVMEFAGVLAQTFANMQTGVLIRAGVTLPVYIAELENNTQTPSSDVEEGARFKWGTVRGFRSFNRIATFDEALIISGTKKVDLENSDVADFVGWMIDGYVPVSTETVWPADYRNSDINSLESALEDFQPNRKRKSK